MLDNCELDRCGVTLLAGKAVGAPFVGAVAVTELLRVLHGSQIHELIHLDLKSPEYRSAVMTLLIRDRKDPQRKNGNRQSEAPIGC